MSKLLPFQSFIRLSAALAIILSLLAFIFLLIAKVDIQNGAIFCAMGMIIIFLIGIADIYLLGFSPSQIVTLKQPRKWKGYLLSYLVSPLIYFVVWAIFSPFTTVSVMLWVEMPYFIIFIISSWLMNALITLLYNFIFLHNSKVQAEIENLQLKASLSESANMILKQQIHPHFLFNVLSTIKSLYKKDARKGETYLVHVSNFLRASLNNKTSKLVRLKEELLLCEDYIEMQKIRFGKALTYSIDIPLHTIEQGFVPYFSLQVLLENAIKHNDLTEESPLHIVIKQAGTCISVTNNIQLKQFKEPSTGLGLANLSERYRLLSGEEIGIREKEGYFSVSIKILSDENSHYRR
jgi:sensor histidine kinase YesM